MAVTTTPTGLPASFLEPFAEKVTDILAGQISPIEKGLDISKITPKVAAVSPVVQAAQQRAATQAGLGSLAFSPTTGEITGVGAGTGVAAYEPYLQRAEALTAPSAYQQYMSPYQQEVISATQKLLSEQRAAGRPQLASTAIQAGAYGVGRAGVAQAEYERQRDIYDASVLADLRQKGLAQAQTLQQQALANQLGLGEFQSTQEAGIVSGLGGVGTGAQAYSQSILDALRAGNIMQQEYPLQQVQRAVGAFSPFLAGQTGLQTPGTPFGTSPGLAAAQAFGATFGPFMQSQQRNVQQPQQQQQVFGLGSLYGGI